MKNYLILLAACLAACLRASAAVPPPEKLLPDDTLAMVTAPDFNKCLAIYSNSPQTQLWKDPAMQAFRSKFTAKFQSALITPLEHDLGIHFDDYTALPQGQFTLAIVKDGWEGTEDKEPGLVLLVDTKDKSAQLKTNLADLKKKWADAGKAVRTEKIRDVDFSVITLTPGDLPKTLKGATGGPADAPNAADKPVDPAAHVHVDVSATASKKTMLYIGQADSLLIMASSPKTVEKILTALSGSGITTLSEAPDFVANQNAMFRDAPLYGWVNLRTLVKVWKQASAAAPADPSSPPPEKIISATGLDGLRSAAFACTFPDEGALFNFLLSVPEDARSGIFKLIGGEPKNCNPPQFVPADAVVFSRYRLDGAKFWDGLKKMVADISPQSSGGLDFLLSSAEAAAREKNPDFDIKKDFFGNLGDDFIAYQKKPKGDTLAETSAPPSMMLIGSPNPAQLGTALNALMALAGPQGSPKEREFLGRKIYSIPMPALLSTIGSPPGAAGAAPPTLSYAADGGYLALSMDGTMIEEYLRSSIQNESKALGDTQGLSAAKDKISSSGTSFFRYENDVELMRDSIKNLKSDTGSSQLENYFEMISMMTGAGGSMKFKDWVDMSLLPNYDQISKYFYFTVYTGGVTPDGLVLKAYSPVSPQLKK